MDGCSKCKIKYGIIIDDELGKNCVHCHPYAISSFSSPQEILDKIEHLDFNHVRERKY